MGRSRVAKKRGWFIYIEKTPAEFGAAKKGVPTGEGGCVLWLEKNKET